MNDGLLYICSDSLKSLQSIQCRIGVSFFILLNETR